MQTRSRLVFVYWLIASFTLAATAAPARGPRPLDRAAASLPHDTVPPEHPEAWPFSIACERSPARVHYQRAGDREMARQVAHDVDLAWALNVDALGFRPPVSDGGAFGGDERFDVYLWRGHKQCYVDTVAENAATPWNDWTTYMVLDPWGPYGGRNLRTTVAHELNHACQAADDWHDAPAVYEMSATYVEQLALGQRLAQPLADFQGNPDWGVDRDDGYETWYMYGSALFLDFVRARYFHGDARFVGRMWLGLRSPPGAETHPERDVPDFEDSLDAMLRPQGSSFQDAVVEFARWRWAFAQRDDSALVSAIAGAPAKPAPLPARTVRARPGQFALSPPPMIMGTSYVVVRRKAGDPPGPLALKLTGDPRARWVVQTIPGPHAEPAGALLPLPRDTARLPDAPEVVVAITALPRGAYDVDVRTNTRFAAVVHLTQ